MSRLINKHNENIKNVSHPTISDNPPKGVRPEKKRILKISERYIFIEKKIIPITKKMRR